MNLFFASAGTLGHGNLNSLQSPHPIEFLRKLPPVSQISAGLNFYLALNQNQDLFGWGQGDYGVFGDGNNKTALLPRKNEIIESMKSEQKLFIKRIKSCNNYTVVQLSDGNLYAWGTNESGQMGVQSEIGVELYETQNFPTQVKNIEFKNNKVVDYEIGEDCMVILLDNNEVWWTGMRLEYRPKLLKLPYNSMGRIKILAAGSRTLAVVDEFNQIYMMYDYVASSS